MINVLFVCMGNICRSPTAHGVMQDFVDKQGYVSKIAIDSAGTHAYHQGEQADSRSRAKAKERGINMDDLRARKIIERDYSDFDYILAMDEDNLESINHFAPSNSKARIALFLSYANNLRLTTESVVPDPYYGGAAGFDHVFDLVEQGCNALLQEIVKTHEL